MEQAGATRESVEVWSKAGRWAGTSCRPGQESRQAQAPAQTLLPQRPHPSVLASHTTQFVSANARTIDVEKALLRPALSIHGSPSRSSPTTPEPPAPAPNSPHDLTAPPPPRLIRTLRSLRFAIFTVYRRLFTLVVLLNLLCLYPLLQRRPHGLRAVLDPSLLALFAAANFCLAALVRADLLLSRVFRAAWLVPWYVPLRVRLCVARLYCYGGIHAGAAVAGTVWWVVFTAALGWRYVNEASMGVLGLAVALATLALLFIIIFFACEPLRARYHNAFEITHRQLGWLVLVLFWIQLLLLTSDHVTASPTFWFLLATTVRTVYPWLLIRRWTFTAHPLSHNVLRLSFSNPIHKFSILSISSAPLREWHPFATFPFSSPKPSTRDEPTSLIISAAGDWTRSITTCAAAQHRLQHLSACPDSLDKARCTLPTLTFWVKPHPKPGVLSLSLLFPRILVITTGSGIGPCLSSLLQRPATSQAARLIWSAHAPRHTYGADVLALVHRADPAAIVIDTQKTGRCDLVEVGDRASREIRAEAVFVLSNRKVTGSVVRGLERRGVRAFGPIWDS